MSLINEALKRAQEDTSLGTRPPVVRTAEDAATDGGRRPARIRGVILIGLLLAGVTVGGWFLWRPMPQPADADSALLPPAGPVMPQLPLPREPLTQDAAIAYSRTVTAIDVYEPTVDIDPPTANAPAPKAVEPDASHQPPKMDLSMDASPDTPATAAKTARPVSPAVPPRPLAVHVQPDVRRVERSAFKLSGIMRGPEGIVAIVNDVPVRTGDIVEDAKVVRIDRYSVVLEVDGDEFTLRM